MTALTRGLQLNVQLNNLDGGISHPFHLHGKPFFLVARGPGNITAADVPNIQIQTTNPLRRDTLMVPAGTWAILRLVTDDPGVWGLHCHIGWHLAQGKVSFCSRLSVDGELTSSLLLSSSSRKRSR